MLQFRKVLFSIGKVLLAIALGYLALIVANIAIGFLFGILKTLFGWPKPPSGTINLILLAIFVLGFLICRDRRKKDDDGLEEILAAHKRRSSAAALMESTKQRAGETAEPK